MSRIARNSINSNFFHIMVQGNNRKDIFISDKLKEKYISLMKEKQKKYNIEIVAYCIMNNHIHLLLYTNEIEEMSQYMRSLNQSFSQYFNKVNERVGTIFRNRFQSEAITEQKYLQNCISYIHNNPIKVGKCNDLIKYKYSSYSDYVEKTGIVNQKIINLVFIDDTNYNEKVKLLHEKSGKFIDCMLPENPSILLKKYINDKKIKYSMIKDNDMLILDVANFLIDSLGLSIRKISELLEIDRKKISKILNKKE